jgi:hypothetical protein
MGHKMKYTIKFEDFDSESQYNTATVQCGKFTIKATCDSDEIVEIFTYQERNGDPLCHECFIDPESSEEIFIKDENGTLVSFDDLSGAIFTEYEEYERSCDDNFNNWQSDLSHYHSSVI